MCPNLFLSASQCDDGVGEETMRIRFLSPLERISVRFLLKAVNVRTCLSISREMLLKQAAIMGCIGKGNYVKGQGGAGAFFERREIV